MTHAYLNAPQISRAKPRCTKRPFATLKEARKALNMGASRSRAFLVEMGCGTMSVYRCERCGFYHLGHKGDKTT